MPLILTEQTSQMWVFLIKGHLITVIRLQNPPYLCTQAGVSQDSPPNRMTSPDHVVFVYIASFQLANQSSVSDQPISVQNLIRPCPPQSAKTMVNAGLPSDSIHQADNTCTLTLGTVPWGRACTVVYAEPPCSSVTLIPSSALNMQGVTSSYHVGRSTTTICIPLYWSRRTTAAH